MADGQPTDVAPVPEQFRETPVQHLLDAAAQGLVGVDHRWLRAIVDRGAEAVQDLVKWGMQERDAPFPIDEDLLAIFRHLKSAEAVPYIIDYIRKDPLEISDETLEALLPLRDAALEPLLALYEEVGEEQGQEIAFILAAFQIRDQRVLKVLVDRLEYDIIDAAIDLELYGDPAARPALEAKLAEVPADDFEVRRDLESAVRNLETESPGPDVSGYDIWENYPEKAEPVYSVLSEEQLLELLKSPSPEYRAGVARALHSRDFGAAVRQQLFQTAKTDPDTTVRANAWEALASEAHDDETIGQAMLSVVRNESAPAEERAGALVGLAEQAGEGELRGYAERFYLNPQTRVRAMRAMWNSFDRSFSSYFPPHLDDEDPEVRRAAIWGTGYLGITNSAEKLRKFFDDEEYRHDALFAYALSVRHEISRGRIQTLLKKVIDAAGGDVSSEDEELIKMALDQRLLLNGHQPVFFVEEQESAEEAPPPTQAKVGRNDQCPCGSGKKYKKCCGAAT